MHQPTSLARFVAEEQRRAGQGDSALGVLIDHIQRACVRIAGAVAAAAASAPSGGGPAVINVQGEAQTPLDAIADAIMVEVCEPSGQLCGMVSEEREHPHAIPPGMSRGRYLLVFDPLDGSSNVEANVTVGTIFSVLRAPDGVSAPRAEDFLQPGHAQVAAGYALYGPASLFVLTLGAGVHGFTLDRDAGKYRLARPDMRVPASPGAIAINASNARQWEPPVQRYIEECVAGSTGPRGRDVNMRWIGTMVAEAHRVLVQGGAYLYPRDGRPGAKPGRLRLLYEASPMAMIMEQAGGAASTGREPLLAVQPSDIHQRIPVILGAREEVERLVRYHFEHDGGHQPAVDPPLFRARSLFRAV